MLHHGVKAVNKPRIQIYETTDCRTALGRDDYRISCSWVCQLCATFGGCVVLTKLARTGGCILVAIHSTIAATRTVHVAAKCEDSPVHLHLQLADTVG